LNASVLYYIYPFQAQNAISLVVVFFGPFLTFYAWAFECG